MPAELGVNAAEVAEPPVKPTVLPTWIPALADDPPDAARFVTEQLSSRPCRCTVLAGRLLQAASAPAPAR